LPCGVSIILGRNGFIWVTTSAIQEAGRKNGGFTPSLKVKILISLNSVFLDFFNFKNIYSLLQPRNERTLAESVIVLKHWQKITSCCMIQVFTMPLKYHSNTRYVSTSINVDL